MLSKPSVLIFAVTVALAGAGDASGQAAAPLGTLAQERGPQPMSAEAIQAAIDSLGNLDFPIRMNASRALRRAPATSVAPALIRAVESHKDQFVRFRALVLLTGFNDARTPQIVREIVSNPNDRLRTVAYMYYEHHPTASMLPALLKALEREDSEFVRPALVRALRSEERRVGKECRSR